MTSLDDLRAAHPDLGFALYAIEPHGTVTLEVHTPIGDVFTYEGKTAAAAIQVAFPPDVPKEPTNVFD